MAKGGTTTAYATGLCGTDKSCVGTLEPNFRPSFDRISDPHIPLTRQKNRVAVDFRSPERLSDRAKSYGSESQQTRSHRKQGGMDEIHLVGIPRARKIRRDD